MPTVWMTTNTNPQLIEAFRVAQWKIETFSPFEVAPAHLSRLRDLDLIIFEITDDVLLDKCRDLCQDTPFPLFVIVANLSLAEAALDAGADDFLVAPGNPIEALLRARKLAQASHIIRVGELAIDLTAWRVGFAGRRVQLSPIEFRLLACLARRIGQMVSYAQILKDVWGWNSEYDNLAQVKNCVSRVRKKIEPDLHNPQYIVSVKGEGYRLRNQRQWEEAQQEGLDTKVMFWSKN